MWTHPQCLRTTGCPLFFCQLCWWQWVFVVSNCEPRLVCTQPKEAPLCTYFLVLVNPVLHSVSLGSMVTLFLWFTIVTAVSSSLIHHCNCSFFWNNSHFSVLSVRWAPPNLWNTIRRCSSCPWNVWPRKAWSKYIRQGSNARPRMTLYQQFKHSQSIAETKGNNCEMPQTLNNKKTVFSLSLGCRATCQ